MNRSHFLAASAPTKVSLILENLFQARLINIHRIQIGEVKERRYYINIVGRLTSFLRSLYYSSFVLLYRDTGISMVYRSYT